MEKRGESGAYGTFRHWMSLAVGVCILALNSTASAQPLIDPGEMHFHVAKVETVDQVPCFLKKKGLQLLHAKQGYKAVVVTLKGTIPSRGRLLIDLGGFAAVWETSAGTLAGTKAEAVCVGAFAGRNIFLYAKEGTFVQKAFDPGPFVTRVVFAMPTSVKTFHIFYPALLHGRAIAVPRDN